MDIQKIAAGLPALNGMAGVTNPTDPVHTLNNKNPLASAADLSPLAQFAYSHEIQELTYTKEETSFGYYKDDGSLAMQAHSVTNFSLRQETYSFELAFSAEALGLTAKDFPDPGKPMVFNFSYQKTEINIDYESVTRQVQTIRRPEDILTDLSKAIRQVLGNPGNKSVSYMLDEEARQSLMGDPKILRLFGELVMVIAAINVQKENAPSTDYLIQVSGKGRPYLDRAEETSIEGSSQTFQFTITIQLPKVDTKPAPSGESPSSLPPAEAAPGITAG